MTRRCLLLSGILCWGGAPLLGQSPKPEREAASLLQGVDTSFFLDSERVKGLSRALESIRAMFPEVADIAGGPDLTIMEVHLADSARERLGRTAKEGRSSGFTRVSSTGLPGLDSLNQEFGVSDVRAWEPSQGSGSCTVFRR